MKDKTITKLVVKFSFDIIAGFDQLGYNNKLGILIRGAVSNLGQGVGGGAASRKKAPYFTLANKQKSLTLKNSLSLLNLYDWKMDCHETERIVHLCFRQYYI